MDRADRWSEERKYVQKVSGIPSRWSSPGEAADNGLNEEFSQPSLWLLGWKDRSATKKGGTATGCSPKPRQREHEDRKCGSCWKPPHWRSAPERASRPAGEDGRA